ncbi:MAG: hypothetical protein JXB39_14600 [Deltaproteobacteria bacterium]|nr:hypothetical protein [Deltaproteobacteria bacterium]
MTRWPALLVAALLDLVLSVGLLASRETPVIHPLAPPLTRIDALGDSTLGPEVRFDRAGDLLLALETLERRSGMPVPNLHVPPEEQARLHQRVEEAGRLRVRIEQDALDLAGVLGSDRVAALLDAREAASDAVGEGAAWDRVVETLSR